MKEIHVNAYTQKDGTYVREHYRTIDSNDFTVATESYNQTSASTPVLTGGVSMDVNLNQVNNGIDWDNVGSIIRQVINITANVALSALPIASQIYQAASLSDKNTVNDLMPPFK